MKPLRTGVIRREIDMTATEAAFEARSWHGAVHGTVPVLSGQILVDDDGEPCEVQAELDLTAIDTGNSRRDKDLRSKRFFDAAAHPVLRFSATDVVRSGEGWQVRGVLSIGRTDCPLVMHVRRGGESYDGFTGTVELTAQELGVRAPKLLIADKVTLRISTRLVS